MKILIISSWYPPIQSGSSFYSESLASVLHKKGHDVAVVTTHWDSKEPRSYMKDGISVLSLPAMVLPRLRLLLNLKIVPISFTRKNCQRLLSFATQFNPDVIHQVNHIFDTALLSSKLSKHLRIPLVCSITTPLQHPNPLIQFAMRLFDRYIINPLIAKNWTKIICLDNEVRRYIKDAYGKKIDHNNVIIGYGVRDSFNNSLSNIPQAIRTPNQILMVGHIHALRNPSKLIESLPKILKKYPETKIIFAGRVQLKKPMNLVKSLGLEKHVQFMGEVTHSEIIKLLFSSELYVAWANGPYTGLGTACIEAMLCDLPVLIDMPEDLFGDQTLKNWKNIVIINKNDVNDISNTIIELFNNKNKMYEIGKQGKIFVKENLNWEIIVDKIESIYKNILESNLEIK